MKHETTKKLRDVIKQLSKLPAEERKSVYEELLTQDERDEISRNMPKQFKAARQLTLAFGPHSPDDFEISKEDLIVLRKPRVFLSHSHKDKKLARSIYNYLQRAGIQVWLDEAELRFGDSLIYKLREAIDSVDMLLALISKNSLDSEWVMKEIEIAINQEIEARKIKVIPMLCDPVELPGFLVGKLYADLSTSYLRKKNLVRLVADINTHFKGKDG